MKKKRCDHTSGIKNRWGNPEIIKRFSTHSFVYLFPNFNAYYYCFGVLGVTAMVTQQPPPSYLYNVMLSLSFVIAQFIVLGLFSHYISFILRVLYDDNIVLRFISI